MSATFTTGDGRVFDSVDAAKYHCDLVFSRTNVILGIVRRSVSEDVVSAYWQVYRQYGGRRLPVYEALSLADAEHVATELRREHQAPYGIEKIEVRQES